MAVAVQVAGLATIAVGAEGAAFADLSILGYTRDGAEIVTEGHYVDIPGDENGGDEGPPIDVQYLGETAKARLELTKWNSTVADTIASRLHGATAGTPGTAGSLMFAGSYVKRVLIYKAGTPNVAMFNFPRAFCRAPIEINKGTKFSTLILELEAYKDANGVLYNTSVT